jgi:phosphate starvation-inducible protein PhoH and related proteins
MPLPKHAELFFGLGPKLTEEQREYLDSIFDNQLTIVNARSGTGKTTLAVGAAKIIGKPLVYIFAPVEEGRMGFRPGTQAEKEREYLQPLKDALIEIGEDPMQVVYNEEDINVIKSGKAWVYPKSHVFARGTNIKDSTVIISETQNFTKSELKKVLTRIHDNCRVILEGHVGQIDLNDVHKSGFQPYIHHFKDKPYAKVVELNWNFRGRLANDADEIA